MSDNQTENKNNDLDQKIAQAQKRAGILSPEEQAKLNARKQEVMGAGASAGVEFAAAIIIPTFLGVWLDQEFETKPLFILTFLLFGMVTAFYNLYRASEKMNSSNVKADSRVASDEKKG